MVPRTLLNTCLAFITNKQMLRTLNIPLKSVKGLHMDDDIFSAPFGSAGNVVGL